MSDWSITDIQDQLEEQKKNKHFLDKTAIAKNTAPGKSADSAAMLEHFLPTKEEEFRHAEKLTPMFDTNARAGAGGTRSGVVGLRPSGGKAASEFLETYTGIGRFTPQAAPFTEKETYTDKGNEHARKPSVVLYKLCMDCMKPVNMDDCVPNMTIVPPPILQNAEESQKWRNVDLLPMDILCYVFCTACINLAVAIQKDPIKQMPLIIGGVETTLAKQELHERGKRISNQVYQAVVNERNNPDSDVFYGRAAIRDSV